MGRSLRLRAGWTGRCRRRQIAVARKTGRERRTYTRAIELYETKRVDFAEADLAACAEHGEGLVGSFDRDLDRIDSVTRVGP
jgi:hypothetical protein